MRRATDPGLYRAQSLNATICGGEVTPCVSVLPPRPPAGDCGAGDLALPAPPRRHAAAPRGRQGEPRLPQHHAHLNPVQDIPQDLLVLGGGGWWLDR